MVQRKMLRLDKRKQATLQWLQDPSEISEDNLNNTKGEASRNFRYKKREYLENKINELATNMQRTVRTRTSETCIVD
jgi:hypothetical protein